MLFCDFPKAGSAAGGPAGGLEGGRRAGGRPAVGGRTGALRPGWRVPVVDWWSKLC